MENSTFMVHDHKLPETADSLIAGQGRNHYYYYSAFISPLDPSFPADLSARDRYLADYYSVRTY